MASELQTELVLSFLARYCAGRTRLEGYTRALWADYRQLDIGDLGHFVSEFTSGDNEKFWQRMWEMQLGSHLLRLGHSARSPAHGPDYRVEHDGRVVWIEAMSPSPKGLPEDWLSFPAPGTSKTFTTPNTEILLKWTGALKEKRAKFQGYARDRITGPQDACVIAINGAQLTTFWAADYGISQMPWAVEAVFPVGPLQAVFTAGKPGVTTRISERFEIRTRNDSPVSLISFLLPDCADISALIGCSRGVEPDMSLPACIIHNPLARVPLPLGLLGAETEEWQAVPVDGVPGGFSLGRVR